MGCHCDGVVSCCVVVALMVVGWMLCVVVVLVVVGLIAPVVYRLNGVVVVAAGVGVV